MSSLPGSNSLSKGDKKKYNTLDINNYQGKGVELQKSTANRQHGMQSLGKVPTARRIPLQSLYNLKSENSGNIQHKLSTQWTASTGWGSGKSATSKTATVWQQSSSRRPRPPAP
ncbi:PRRC2C [Bugula neritina]|uniref:PRRC2C n=1 Tax=Bugula neritina TaxID=10212 RepID=A0A7J7K3W2_BUGNE|nr:PRRC2C [Bugula neritina]